MGFVHEKRFPFLTLLSATLPHQISLSLWVVQDLFSKVLPETASTLAWHSCMHHTANPMPPSFLWIYLVECWGCMIWLFGVVWVFIWGRVYFILFSASEEEQRKCRETSKRGGTSPQTVPSSSARLLVVSSELSSGCSRNSRFSSFFLFPQTKAKRRSSCSTGPSLPPRCLFYCLWSQKKEAGPSQKVYFWLAVCSKSGMQKQSHPGVWLCLTSQEEVHIFTEKDKWDKTAGVFLFY